ncbi:hypothetical protein Q3G72_022894 [Acer saccharum]|nr:hypothetical protein Q3G72_022894 [Acer saccharum]
MVGNSSTLGKATARSSHTGICSQSVTLPETPLTTPPSTNTLRLRVFNFMSIFNVICVYVNSLLSESGIGCCASRRRSWLLQQAAAAADTQQSLEMGRCVGKKKLKFNVGRRRHWRGMYSLCTH